MLFYATVFDVVSFEFLFADTEPLFMRKPDQAVKQSQTLEMGRERRIGQGRFKGSKGFIMHACKSLAEIGET